MVSDVVEARLDIELDRGRGACIFVGKVKTVSLKIMGVQVGVVKGGKTGGSTARWWSVVSGAAASSASLSTSGGLRENNVMSQ